MAFVPKITINETDEGFIHPYSQTPFATREAMWADLQQNFSPNHDWQRQDIEYVEQATEGQDVPPDSDRWADYKYRGQDYTRFRPDPPPPPKRADFVEQYKASERREAQLKQDRLNYPDWGKSYEKAGMEGQDIPQDSDWHGKREGRPQKPAAGDTTWREWSERTKGSRAALDAGHQHPGHTAPRGAGTYMINQQTGRGEWVPDQAPDDPNEPWGEEDMIESETTPDYDQLND